MSGHVFHPGHEELHGITVFVEGRSGRAYVGRYHEHGPRGVVMHDVAVHDQDTPGPGRTDWVLRQRKFGIAVTHRHLVIPSDEVGRIERLVDWAPT